MLKPCCKIASPSSNVIQSDLSQSSLKSICIMKYLCDVILRECGMWRRPFIQGGSKSHVCHAIQKAFSDSHFNESYDLSKELTGQHSWNVLKQCFSYFKTHKICVNLASQKLTVTDTSGSHISWLLNIRQRKVEEMAQQTKHLSWTQDGQNLI